MVLTKHERHARLVKIVRRTYQADNPGSRLFPNTSGVAWQGNAINGAGKVELHHPRPIRFGIPEPSGDGEKSGGSDLLGETGYCEMNNFECNGCKKLPCIHFIPIATGIECKSGNGKLKKNQKVFRDQMKLRNCIWYMAVECPTCWDKWVPVYKSSRIIKWIIPECDDCGGKGFTLEDE